MSHLLHEDGFHISPDSVLTPGSGNLSDLLKSHYTSDGWISWKDATKRPDGIYVQQELFNFDA